jgi:hypothetical protein
MSDAVYEYKHVGDRPLALRGRLVKPGDVFQVSEPVISNGNFEAQNDAAKKVQEDVNADDADRLQEHLASISGAPPESTDAAAIDEAPARRSKKSASAAEEAPAAAPQEG